MEKINTDNEYEIARRLKEYRAAVLEFIDYLYDNRSLMRDDIKTIEMSGSGKTIAFKAKSIIRINWNTMNSTKHLWKN